ncbi:MAG: hypothetical protein LBD30_07770 [Verrucomicrobiales bacterium]|jgi:hypothetical protein|nr:hypothetical protein [Verrucomicrobiales bacterium]
MTPLTTGLTRPLTAPLTLGLTGWDAPPAPPVPQTLVLAPDGGRYLAVSVDDGETWSMVDGGVSGAWDVIYAAGRFVAKIINSSNPTVLVSADRGHTWETSQMPALGSSYGIVSLAYADGQFAAGVHNSANFFTSPDGLDWTKHTSGAARKFKCSAFAPPLGRWVSTQGTYTYEIYSDDGGDTWTVANTGAGSFDSENILWSARRCRFVVFAVQWAGGRYLTSPDGVVWQCHSTLPNHNDWLVARGQEQLDTVLAFCNTAQVAVRSDDWLNWTTCQGPGFTIYAQTPAVIYDGRHHRHLAAGRNVIALKASADFGDSWHSLPDPPFKVSALAVSD